MLFGTDKFVTAVSFCCRLEFMYWIGEEFNLDNKKKNALIDFSKIQELWSLSSFISIKKKVGGEDLTISNVLLIVLRE